MLEKIFVNHKIWVSCLVVLLMGSGIFLFLRDQTKRPPSASKVVSAISLAKGNSSTDQIAARWIQKVRREPKNDKAWVNLGNAIMQKAREAEEGEFIDNAEAVFQKALSLNRKNADAMVGISWVHSSRHDFELSIEWAKKAIFLDAENHRAYGLLGDADLERGHYDSAYENYQKMLDIRPDLASYSRGAHLLYLTGDITKATLLMQKAIAAGGPYFENTAWCYAQLALMLWSNGAVLPAEQAASKGLKQSPDNHHLLFAMGKVKAAQKDYIAAMNYYKKAIAVVPRHEAIVELGDLYLISGNMKKAEEQYSQVEEFHHSNKSHEAGEDMQLARFYADHDRNLAQALQTAEIVYKFRKNVFATDTLAWCYYQNGRYEEAAKYIEKAMKIGTADANIYFHAGMIYAKLGRSNLSKKHLYEALSLNPNFHPIFAPVAVKMLKKLSAYNFAGEQ